MIMVSRCGTSRSSWTAGTTSWWGILEGKMRDAAAALEYEEAALYRDQLQAVGRVRERQRVVADSDLDQDVIGLHRQADQAEVAVLRIRSGKLVGVRTFALSDLAIAEDEILAAFVREHYELSGVDVPDEVIVPRIFEAMDGLAELLADRRGRRVKVVAPQRGKRVRLVEMARENASHAFAEKQRAAEDVDVRLRAVQKKLRLPELPRRVECIDISHSGGEDTVAAIVSMKDGQPEKDRYRTFHLQTVSGGDDYAAIYEALSRRFCRALRGDAGWDAPDLLVVDGGKGQLKMATSALSDLGVEEVPVVGLAKEKESVLGEKLVDRVYLVGQKNPIPVHATPALQMLAFARDEAHRTSNRIRLKRGKKKKLKSVLDAIPGVGPKTRSRLLRELGSADAVLQAAPAALRAAGANARQIEAIAAFVATGLADPPRADDA